MSELKLFNIEALEWDDVRKFISSFAVFERTIKKLSQVTPLKKVSDENFIYLKDFLEIDPDEINLKGIEDIYEYVRRAEKGGLLSGVELLGVASFIRSFISLKDLLRSFSNKLTHIYSHLLSIDIPLHIMRDIYRTIDNNGNVYDTADKELPPLRRRITKLREKVEDIFKKFKEEKGRIFQDDYITIRNRRFVFPVKAGEKGWIDGIIHGKSSTEETYFIEPVELIDVNNELRMCEEKLEEIQKRIFMKLSERVKEECESLSRMLDFIILLDETLAKARFMKAISGCIPLFKKGLSLKLYGLKHPLLLKNGRKVVPNDVVVDKNTRGIVISGPNAGGKTVLLKSIGLSVALAYSGLPVPCENAEIGGIDGVCVEIGDPQNLAFGLSTFSGHLFNLKRIYEISSSRCLILLDEAFSGTNPAEGDALLMGYAEEMMERGNLIIMTTHSPEVMAWAERREDTLNYGMGYDPETLTPTYKGEVGRIGISASFDVARRMGFPDGVIVRAREKRRMESSLSELYYRLSQKEKEVEKKLSEIIIKEKSLTEEICAMDKREKELQEKRKRLFKDMREEVRRVKRELKKIMEKVKKDQKANVIEKALEEVEKMERRYEDIYITLNALPEKGEEVVITSLNKKGTVNSVDRKRRIVEVDIEGRRIKVPLHLLGKER